MGDFCSAGQIPNDKIEAGYLRGHQVHSTVTTLQTPVYSSAPTGLEPLFELMRISYRAVCR
jgi:hypothetical protein